MPKLTPEFIERMFDVLKQYETAYDSSEPRINIDEKTSQLLDTPRGRTALKPGQPCREDYEYCRFGTMNHFVCLEPKAGLRHIRVTRRRTAADFARFMRHIVMKAYGQASCVHITIDNLNTHRDESILNYYGEKKGRPIVERIRWHYTPKHASWLNAAEIEIGMLTKAALKKRIPNGVLLKKEVRAYVRRRNRSHAMIQWQFTQEKAMQKFKLNKEVLHQN